MTDIWGFVQCKKVPMRPTFGLVAEDRHPDQERVQPHQENHVKRKPSYHGDDVVPGRSGLGHGDEAGRPPTLQRDAVIDGVSQERAEQDDRGEIAIGDQMGERPGADGIDERVLDLALIRPGT
jgi:hypothetical protein